MNVQGLIGRKIDQTQSFLEDGTRVPVSHIMVLPNIITQIKTMEKEGYNALQMGFDFRKKVHKSILGHFKKAGMAKSPRFLHEIRVDELSDVALGGQIKADDVFKPGDIIDVTGTSKGKGYAGVVKRHNFRGGPRTHGQSDRERAPGSIGQTTTPGRVYKGKKMAGNMGNDRVTIKNLEILDVATGTVLVKGLVPGVRNGIVFIKVVGKNKKFIPLYKKKTEDPVSQEPVENASPVKKITVTEEMTDKAEDESASASSSAIASEDKKISEDKPAFVDSASVATSAKGTTSTDVETMVDKKVDKGGNEK